MSIIAFVTDPVPVRSILSYLDLPTRPPPLSPARAPPPCGRGPPAVIYPRTRVAPVLPGSVFGGVPSNRLAEANPQVVAWDSYSIGARPQEVTVHTPECAPQAFNRRAFLLGSTGAFMGSMVPEALHAFMLQQAGSRHIMGPVAGYSPLVGTLVSMMNWIRPTVIGAVADLSQEQLDYLYDSESNTIGALLLHLAATEVSYQRNTLERQGFTAAERKEWRTASDLGAEARATIKGHPLDYYLSRLEEVHAWTLEEFRRRDDDWLAEVDPSFFGGQPTNNFAKWFHVVEHEGNHRGQITWFRKRLPGGEFANAVRGA